MVEKTIPRVSRNSFRSHAGSGVVLYSALGPADWKSVPVCCPVLVPQGLWQSRRLNSYLVVQKINSHCCCWHSQDISVILILSPVGVCRSLCCSNYYYYYNLYYYYYYFLFMPFWAYPDLILYTSWGQARPPCIFVWWHINCQFEGIQKMPPAGLQIKDHDPTHGHLAYKKQTST